MRVLVVDDDPVQRRIVRVGMARAGYQVEEAADGPEALECVHAGGPRLVITDWMMPRMDGPDLIRRFREAGQEPSTDIMLLTARAVAERLHATVTAASLHAPDRSEIRVTISAGVYAVPPGGRLHFDVYLQRADEALYEAKRTGRDRVVVCAAPPEADTDPPLIGPWQQRPSQQAAV